MTTELLHALVESCLPLREESSDVASTMAREFATLRSDFRTSSEEQQDNFSESFEVEGFTVMAEIHDRVRAPNGVAVDPARTTWSVVLVDGDVVVENLKGIGEENFLSPEQANEVASLIVSETVRESRLAESDEESPDTLQSEQLDRADEGPQEGEGRDSDATLSTDDPKFDTLVVPSKAYAALWTGELLGQVVDGAYMNRSGDHKRWESMRVEVDLSRKSPILNTSTARPLQGNFPFDQDVVPVVGSRMLALCKQVDPSTSLVDVSRMCQEISVALRQPREE